MKGPPRGQGCHLLLIVATFWALVRLLSCFSVDLQYLSYMRGGEGHSIHLRVLGGDNGLHRAFKIHVCRLKYIFDVEMFRSCGATCVPQYQESIAVPTTGRWYIFPLERGIPQLDCNSV